MNGYRKNDFGFKSWLRASLMIILFPVFKNAKKEWQKYSCDVYSLDNNVSIIMMIYIYNKIIDNK